jgi:Zn-dependent peptidase ImmA (M78 family)/transcriptional regulator with XRE-family HTH domain
VSQVQPEKIVAAREARGLTQADLAARLGVSQPTLSKLESGVVTKFQDEALARLVEQLGFTESFFVRSDRLFGTGASELVHHRKRQSTAAKVLRRAYALMSIQSLQVNRLLQSLDIECKVPHLSLEEYPTPEDVARAVRAMWMVPAGPVVNLTETIERAGAVVFLRDYDSPRVDGFSMWAPGQPPLFFLNSALPPSRRRLTLAHELGHVVMHLAPSPTMEDEANRFAGEFLMPERDIRPDLVAARLTLPRLAELKQKWKASMAAVLMRASQLGTISQPDAGDLWIRLSKAGYKRMEPLERDIPDEQPTLFREMLDIHRKTLAYGPERLAELIFMKPEELTAWYMPDEIPRLRVVRAGHK